MGTPKKGSKISFVLIWYLKNMGVEEPTNMILLVSTQFLFGPNDRNWIGILNEKDETACLHTFQDSSENLNVKVGESGKIGLKTFS